MLSSSSVLKVWSLEIASSTEQLEELLAKTRNPKLLYTISEGHNPLGISLSKVNRLKLINIARSYALPIVEDG